MMTSDSGLLFWATLYSVVSIVQQVRGRHHKVTFSSKRCVLFSSFLRGWWLHRRWLHPARRPQLGSSTQNDARRQISLCDDRFL